MSSEWESVVTVREDRSVEQELAARWARRGVRRAVGVTDLLALRRAYYRRLGPTVALAPERQARLEQGRAVHRLLGDRLAHEGVLEARVRREGIVGRIDLLADVPVEVKTGSSFVDPNALAGDRPDHLEQLAMYCALLDRTTGRLLTLKVEGKGVVDAQALEIEIAADARVYDRLRERARLLWEALKDRTVDGLPRCPWFGRGCEYGEASACGCTGTESAAPPLLGSSEADVRVRADVAARVKGLFAAPAAPEPGPVVGRFRDLLYPRRAYFESVTPPPSKTGETPAYVAEPDLYAQLAESVEGGAPGEVCRLPSEAGAPEEEVVGFRHEPVLVRTSRAWSRFRPSELVRRSPQYALELGLRCAVTGSSKARLVVGFERAEEPRDKIQVLELDFASLTPFSRFYRDRARALADAVQVGSPETLAPCPEWMVADCPYRASCGCDASPRATR